MLPEKNFAKLKLATDLSLNEVDLQHLALFNAVLHPAISNNCVHDPAPYHSSYSGARAPPLTLHRKESGGTTLFRAYFFTSSYYSKGRDGCQIE